ncbi:MAG: phosphate/phosphite/phosphonate ABC transporter substrate-binding protein [Gammaproteobacteria bacterium]|nr:phosphate/phosphite/phosphonate ABC transporter substrate-binding protein [Gammaproteobacteria bacterium]
MSVLMLALIFPGAWASDKPDQRPLRLGLLPYLSTEKLVKTYAPLANYLERQLKRKVIITTAPGFKEYLKRANQGRYDVFFTAPHFAAYAETRYNHSRLARLARSLDGTIVVPADSTIKKISDLRGRVLSTPDRLAVITIQAEQLLAQNGLVPGRDVTIRYASSHNNAMKTVLDGLSDAAISLSALYDKMSPKLKSRLRVLAKTPPIPHAMFMASGKIDKQTCEAIRQSLLAFGESPQGKLFFKNTGFVNFIKISDENMNTVMRFVPALEGRLK